MRILIINGPNLNMLGQREPDIYGSETMEDVMNNLRRQFPDVSLDYYQSNHEGSIIDKIHEVGFGGVDGIILNAGAYTHTSVAIHDAIKAVRTPVIEVHISNVHQREEFRHHSFISPAASGIIIGFGLESYHLALLSFITKC